MTTNRLTPRARGLRQVGGLAEERIWARLRGGAVDGWKVRRQHPIGRYVVDFACVPLRLVIEIDGGVQWWWIPPFADWAFRRLSAFYAIAHDNRGEYRCPSRGAPA